MKKKIHGKTVLNLALYAALPLAQAVLQTAEQLMGG